MKNRIKISGGFMMILSVAINLVLTLQYFITASPNFIDYLFNADLLFMHTLYDDFFISGQGIKGWTFPGGQFFFPDMALYFLIRTFVEHPGTIYLIYVFIQQSLILFAVVMLVSKIFQEGYLWIAAASILMFSLIPAIAIINNEYLFPFYLYTVNFHIGVFLLSLLHFSMVIDYTKRPRNRLLVFIFFITFLGYLSDKLFLFMAIAPTIAASSLLWWRGQNKLQPIKLTTLMLLAFAVAIGTTRLLDIYLIDIARYNTKPDFSTVSTSVTIIGKQLYDYIRLTNLRSLVVLLYFTCVFVGTLLFFKKFKKSKPNELFWILFALVFLYGVFLAPIASGLYIYTPRIRYNISVYYLSLILFFPILLQFGLLRLKQLKIVATGIAILFCFVVYKGMTKQTVKLNYYSNYYPKYIQALDSLAQEFDLKNGLSTYWQSTQIRTLSKSQLKVYNTFPLNLRSDYFLSNKSWYYLSCNEENQPVFNFIYINSALNDSLLDSKFDTVYCYWVGESMHFYFLPEFVYNANRDIEKVKK
jgi:hypothetical protein